MNERYAKCSSNYIRQSNVYVHVCLGRDTFISILERYGGTAWNIYVERLRKTSTFAMFSSPIPGPDSSCMPVWLEFDFSNESFKGMDLSDLDLTLGKMDGADFSHAKLCGSRFWDVSGANFRHADLRYGALFSGDTTAADFTDADTSYTIFDACHYTRGYPPVGLTQEIVDSMAIIEPDPPLDSATASLAPIDVRVLNAKVQSFWD